MKRILLAGMLSFMMLLALGQDVKSIRKALEKNDLTAAKTQVDAFIAKNPSSPEALYMQAKVYSMIAVNDQLKSTVPDARNIAFQAFQNAIAKGDNNKEFMILQATESNNFYKPIFDLYTGYYDEAANKFNTAVGTGNKEDFKLAYEQFKNANTVGQYIAKNKWALSELDTALELNLGKAALNAGMKAEAMHHFKRLADANIHKNAQGGGGYELAYQWLALQAKIDKDEASLLKYTKLGQQFFPDDDYYDAVLLDHYREKKDKENLFKTYENITTKFPDSLSYHFNYANEVFNHIYNADEGTKIENKEALLSTINRELSKAMALKPGDVNTNWLYGQYYYNQGVDFREQARLIRGTKPDDIKKRDDLLAKATESFNKAIPYADKAMTTLEQTTRKSDKSKYKSIVDLNTRIYQSLVKPDKVKIFQGKYDGADALFVK